MVVLSRLLYFEMVGGRGVAVLLERKYGRTLYVRYTMSA